MVMQCFLSEVADNRPPAAFWFDHRPRPTKSGDLLKRGRRSCQDTQGALSSVSKLEADTVTLSGVCPERETCSHLARPSLLHIILRQGQHDGFEPNQSRRQENLLCRRDWLQLRRTARSEWMAVPTQEVAAIFLCHLCEHPHSVNCPVVLRLFMPRFLLHHMLFGHGVRGGLGARPAASTVKPLMQEGLDPASKNCTFRMGHPPRPRRCSQPLVCRVQAPPLEQLSQDESGRQGPCRMAPMAWYRTPRQCRRLRITIVPPPAQHDTQSTGCFHSLCPVQYRTHGVCSQLFGSGISKNTPLTLGPSKPWELDPVTRRRRVRIAYPTMNEKDAILEAMQEQQDWEDSPLLRWPGDADAAC